MTKLYDLISNLWILLVGDTIPAYIEEALYWTAFAIFMIAFLAIPIIMVLMFKLLKFAIAGGKGYND